MKPLDLTKPVMTRHECKVRILCTDAPGPFPVVGYVVIDPELNTTSLASWTEEGHYNGDKRIDAYDLVQVPPDPLEFVREVASIERSAVMNKEMLAIIDEARAILEAHEEQVR